MSRASFVPKKVHHTAPSISAAIEGAYGNGAPWPDALAEAKALVAVARAATGWLTSGHARCSCPACESLREQLKRLERLSRQHGATR